MSKETHPARTGGRHETGPKKGGKQKQKGE